MTIAAKYEDGVFKPLDVVNIKEGTIVGVHVPDEEKHKPLSIRHLGFTGMWADRDDIRDGLSRQPAAQHPAWLRRFSQAAAKCHI